MKTYFSSFLFLLFICQSCSKRENPKEIVIEEKEFENPLEPKEPNNEVYFTLNIKDFYNTSNSDNWIIIHDENGELLDFKQYESGSSINFELPVELITNKIMVTDFKVEEDRVVSHRINTTMEVDKGSTWDFGIRNNEEIPDKIGEWPISITIPNGGKMFEISNKYGKIRSGWLGTNSNSDETLTINYNLTNFQNSSKYLISIIDETNDIKYVFLDNPSGEELAVTPSDFKLYDSYQDISFPPYSFLSFDLYGFETNQESIFQSYCISSYNQYENPSKPNNSKLGFLDIFDRYYFSLWMNMDGYTYARTDTGDRINPINIPDKPNLVILDDSMNSFDFEVDMEYTSVANKWSFAKISSENPPTFDIITEWNILTPKGYNFKLIELPEEIVQKYPKLNLDKIEYSQTDLIMEKKEGENISIQSVILYN